MALVETSRGYNMSEQDYFIAPIVKELFTPVRKRVITKDRDYFMVIDGEEGSGKSVLAQQLAKMLDDDFNIDKIVFTAEDFTKIIKSPKTKKGACIVLDEAMNAANARGSLSEVNRAMQTLASEMRQKNLFVIFCIPSFFDLDKYFALWRCRTLVHVYFTPEENRRYLIFPKNHKKMLYLNGKKTYSYKKPHSPYPPFSFPNHYTVDEAQYRWKKSQAFKRRTVSNQARKWMLQRNAFAKYILATLGIAQEDVAKIPQNYGAPILSQRQISNIAKEIVES